MKWNGFFILFISIFLYLIYPKPIMAYTYPDKNNNDVSLHLLGGLSLAKINYNWGDPAMAAEAMEMEPFHKYRTGVCVGFGIETRGQVGFILEFLYHQKGDKIDFDDGIDLIQSTITIHEMSLPVLLKLNLSKNTGPYILLGGEIGFILSALEHSVVYMDVGINEHDIIYVKKNENITKSLKQINYGLILGTGFKVKTKGMSFFVEVRYHHGLADISKNDIKSHPDDKMKTNAIFFNIGISK